MLPNAINKVISAIALTHKALQIRKNELYGRHFFDRSTKFSFFCYLKRLRAELFRHNLYSSLPVSGARVAFALQAMASDSRLNKEFSAG